MQNHLHREPYRAVQATLTTSAQSCCSPSSSVGRRVAALNTLHCCTLMVCRPHRIMWSLKHLAGESCELFCSNSSTDTVCGTSKVTSWYPTRSLNTPPGLLSSILPSPQLPQPSCMPFNSSLIDGFVCVMGLSVWWACLSVWWACLSVWWACLFTAPVCLCDGPVNRYEYFLARLRVHF